LPGAVPAPAGAVGAADRNACQPAVPGEVRRVQPHADRRRDRHLEKPGGPAVLIVDVLLPKERRAALAWVTLLVIGATMVSLLPFTGTRVEVAHGLLAVDRFGLFFKFVFLLAARFTVLMSVRYLAIEGASPGEYYFLILCATLGMMIMAGGIDLITIFIGRG